MNPYQIQYWFTSNDWCRASLECSSEELHTLASNILRSYGVYVTEVGIQYLEMWRSIIRGDFQGGGGLHMILKEYIDSFGSLKDFLFGLLSGPYFPPNSPKHVNRQELSFEETFQESLVIFAREFATCGADLVILGEQVCSPGFFPKEVQDPNSKLCIPVIALNVGPQPEDWKAWLGNP